jgi:hypothetical protein
MIKIHRYSQENQPRWDAFVDASKNGTFMLKRGYMDYHSDRYKDHSMMFYNSDKLVAVLPASQHGSELRSHGGLTYGGLIISTETKVQQVIEIFMDLKEYMKEQGISSLLYKRVPEIYYRYPSDEDLYALYRIGANLVRRDISSTIYLPSKIKFSERRKRGSKQAAKQGIIVKQSTDYVGYIVMLSKILLKYHDTKPVHTAEELKLLSSRFPEAIKLYSAYREDKMLAGVVVFETDKVAHAQYIANSDEGRQCGALDAVMDYLINQQYANKEYFDFGVSTENNGMYLNEGLVTQKQEFGGRGVAYDFYEIRV